MDVLDLLSQDDLCNLALVSSQVLDLAQRVLFRSIHLVISFPPTDPRNLYPFTRLVNTLSRNPHLQLYVSTLSFRVWGDGFKDHESLLILIPRLQSLYLCPPPGHSQLSNCPLPFLQTLGLNFSGSNRPRQVQNDPVEIIAQQFWAPCLRRLYIHDISFRPQMSVLFPSERTGLHLLQISDFKVVTKRAWAVSLTYFYASKLYSASLLTFPLLGRRHISLLVQWSRK